MVGRPFHLEKSTVAQQRTRGIGDEEENVCTSVSVTIRETLLASSLARRVRDISRARASSHARVGWSANRRKERGGEEEEGKRITVLLQSGNDADRVQQFRAIPPEYRAFRECGSAFSRPLYVSLPLSAVASLSLSLSCSSWSRTRLDIFPDSLLLS